MKRLTAWKFPEFFWDRRDGQKRQNHFGSDYYLFFSAGVL